MLPTPALPPVGRARDADVMGRSVVPKVLENWMRMRSAGMEMWRVWRRVASLRIADPDF